MTKTNKNITLELSISGLDDKIKKNKFTSDGELYTKTIITVNTPEMNFEELLEVLDKKYVEFTVALKHNWNESISTKG